MGEELSYVFFFSNFVTNGQKSVMVSSSMFNSLRISFFKTSSLLEHF